jgi:hypothetical protein
MAAWAMAVVAMAVVAAVATLVAAAVVATLAATVVGVATLATVTITRGPTRVSGRTSPLTDVRIKLATGKG